MAPEPICNPFSLEVWYCIRFSRLLWWPMSRPSFSVLSGSPSSVPIIGAMPWPSIVRAVPVYPLFPLTPVFKTISGKFAQVFFGMEEVHDLGWVSPTQFHIHGHHHQGRPCSSSFRYGIPSWARIPYCHLNERHRWNLATYRE